MLKMSKAKQRLIVNLVLLTAMFLVNCFWQNMIWVAFPVLLIFCVSDNLENGFTYLLWSLPYYLIGGNITSVLYFSCIIAFVIKFYFILFFVEKNKLTQIEVLTMGLFVFYMALPMGAYDMNWFTKFCLILFVIAFVNALCRKPEMIRLNFNVRLLSISLVVSCLIAFTYPISPWLESVKPLEYVVYPYIRFQGLFDSANVLALFCEIILGLLTYLLISNKKRRDWALFVLVAVIGVFTFSKIYLLIIVILLLTLFISYLKYSPERTLIITSIVALICCFVCVTIPDIIRTLIVRFRDYFKDCSTFAEFVNVATSGKLDSWILYSEHLAENPLRLFFGFGLGASRLNVSMPNNAYISMLYHLGIVGIVIFTLAVGMIIKNRKKKQVRARFNKAMLIPLIVLGIILCFEDMFFFILDI